MTTTQSETEEIIAVATRLFAQLGFDGTSTELIGSATGLRAGAVTELVGTKTDLYRTVVERAHHAEQAAIAHLLDGSRAPGPTMRRLLDAYLDFYSENPHLVELWLHRRMGDAAHVRDLEDLYVRPTFLQVADALRDTVPDDVDVDYVIWTVLWLVSGFLSTGVMHSLPRDHPHGNRPHITPEDLEDFRAYLHKLIRRMLNLQD